MTRLDVGSDSAGSWIEIVDSYVAAFAPSAPVVAVLAQFRLNNPIDITAAVDPEIAAAHRSELAAFLLTAIQSALADHTLSDSEVYCLRHACRILRVEEGGLLALQRGPVINVLATELERLLEDEFIDSKEAIHKVRLQEVLGLSYDEFVSLTAAQIEGVLLRLLRRVDNSLGPSDLAARIHWFRDCTTALDTIYNFNPAGARTDRSGYVYLLVNPAMPGIIKIGKTTRAPDARVVELSGATGVPVPFELLFDVRVLDAHKAEQYVHDRLEELGARVAANREFFNVTSQVAVTLMLEARDAIGGFSADGGVSTAMPGV